MPQSAEGAGVRTRRRTRAESLGAWDKPTVDSLDSSAREVQGVKRGRRSKQKYRLCCAELVRWF